MIRCLYLCRDAAHCGGFYLRDIVEEKCRLRPACRKLPGLSREKTWITPRLSETSGAQQRKNMDYAPLVGNFRGSAEKKHELRPACRKLPGLSREKTWITPRLSETSGAQQRKNMDYAPLVRNFRGSAEKKHGLRPILRMVAAVHRISDIVHETGDLHKFNIFFRIAEFFQNLRCPLCHQSRMRLRMIGESHGTQIRISFLINVSTSSFFLISLYVILLLLSFHPVLIPVSLYTSYFVFIVPSAHEFVL